MLNLDSEAFTKAYAELNASLSPKALTGFSTLANCVAADENIADARWAAYMLATVKHECANRWRPIEEFGKGRKHPYGVAVEVRDADGTTYLNSYYGRGYVQLTWKLNYDRVGRALGLGNSLVLHPEHALEPQTAYRVMSYGMREGIFTGKKLTDYIHEEACDYFHARRIINGLDRAELIQDYARSFEMLLNKCKLGVTAAASGGGG
jgi:hypothetical protein